VTINSVPISRKPSTNKTPLIRVSNHLGREVKILAWATDIHFDHIYKNEQSKVKEFTKSIQKQNPDILLLTGDIDLGLASDKYGNLGVVETVKKIQELVKCDVLFVCGNHDFYYEYFENVRKQSNHLTLEKDHVLYLHKKAIIELNRDTALIGIDGWYDGHAGDLLHSTIIMNDFLKIKDFNDKSKVCDEKLSPFTQEMKEKLTKLAKPGIDYVTECLPKLFKSYKKVVLGTHVPPFWKACYDSKNKLASKNSAPFHVNKLLGDALVRVMKRYPKKELLVLCGHSHFHADYSPLKNLRVITGGAQYGSPLAQNCVHLNESFIKKVSFIDKLKAFIKM
jgi:3',5'-cyclic-AMP phosphodiesterase